MRKSTVRISEAEAADNFRSLLAIVREGAEVVIEENHRPIAVVRSAEEPFGRSLSEAIEILKARGSNATLDDDFARDLEAVIASYSEPFDPPAWE